jgi:hypothetical protein
MIPKSSEKLSSRCTAKFPQSCELPVLMAKKKLKKNISGLRNQLELEVRSSHADES